MIFVLKLISIKLSDFSLRYSYLNLGSISIYEYEKSINDNYSYSKTINGINRGSKYFFLHNITSTRTKYVKFHAVFSCNDWTYVYDNIYIAAKTGLILEEYYLYNRKPLDIYNLASNYSYYSYLEFFEEININLIINNMTQEPFLNIYIHELENRGNCSSLKIFNKSISVKKNNNQLISSFSYTNTYCTNFSKLFNICNSF